MRTHHLSVPRTARYHQLGELGNATRELWIVCHGYGQLAARFLGRFGGLDDGTRVIVAPEALSRFYLDDGPGMIHTQSRVGATWMTREDREHEIADYVRYLDLLHARLREGLDGRRTSLTVLGFSQGVATVVRWVAMGAVRPDRLILWAGGLPADLDPETTRAALGRPARLTVVAGTQDQFATPDAVARQHAALRELGIAFEHVGYEGGHRIEPDALRRVAAGRENGPP